MNTRGTVLPLPLVHQHDQRQGQQGGQQRQHPVVDQQEEQYGAATRVSSAPGSGGKDGAPSGPSAPAGRRPAGRQASTPSAASSEGV